MDIRKITVVHETIYLEGGGRAARPVSRVAGLGVIKNPFCGRYVDDLSDLFQVGFDLGERLMADMLAHLPGTVVSYGKAAIVGVNGDLEHAHAMLHPRLGKAMREPIGGGEAIIPSAAKVAVAGATLDIPLGHKDDLWSFDHFDAMTVSMPDGPRPDEIVMAIAIANGGRPVPRIGKERVGV